MKVRFKTLLSFFLSIVCILCVFASCSDDKTPNKKMPESSLDATATPVKIEAGEEYEEAVLLDEDYQMYTKDTLPSDYEKYDFDGDGLNNKDELEKGSNMYKSDTDGDGIIDGDEVQTTKTDLKKYSSRDDEISDLEWYLTQEEGFTAGYTQTDVSGFKVYLQNAGQRLYTITKVKTDAFDALSTITEPYQIKHFSGTIALDCTKYTEDVISEIEIYRLNENLTEKLETKAENGLLSFSVDENDIFVAVYNQ